MQKTEKPRCPICGKTFENADLPNWWICWNPNCLLAVYIDPETKVWTKFFPDPRYDPK